MALEVLQYARFTGPALPEPFVRFELENELARARLVPRTTGGEGAALQEGWANYRRKLRELVATGGPIRVRNHVIEPLVPRLGYTRLESTPEVETREGRENGGDLLVTEDGSKLRVWSVGLDEDLDAPSRRGRAYRFSHVRVAQRVLLATGERVGLITNGADLRLLLSDPARPDSQIEIPIDPHWKRSREAPDTYRLVLALASPAGVAALPQILEKARLQQTRVTRELRRQAREAVELFVQAILDLPENRAKLDGFSDRHELARALWHEGLVVVYRLLFILKLESSDDPARSFSFASTSLWRNSFSPSIALARPARAVLDQQAETGSLLEAGVRGLFRMFAEGLQCTELHVRPLGGALFGPDATPILSTLRWSERALAFLLDRLLWTPPRRGAEARERVHYGTLDVEDLGRVYEALLELEPGIATEPMCRLRRQKLEVVLPRAQGESYRPVEAVPANDQEDGEEVTADEADDDEETGGRRNVRVEWIEEIAAGRFYLRVGLGRKASSSYYTPHSFVRFLVQETLGPHVMQRSPPRDPRPGALLNVKVLDPAMGSGHFLVETCRFLGERLYEACRLCDERALVAERRAEQASDAEARTAALAEAQGWRRRVAELPDPDDQLVSYLPSRAPEGEESGYSQRRAEALCRRLVATHCLYGVDINPLAVELAKLALWLECHSEGMPLTFLDHRLLVGNSVTAPFFEQQLTFPGSRQPLADLFCDGLREALTLSLSGALAEVRALGASVGSTVADIEAKRAAKARLEADLAPFRALAAAWAGGVQLGQEGCDDGGFAELARVVADKGDVCHLLTQRPKLAAMVRKGIEAFPYDLAFPEVFFPNGDPTTRNGFHAVLGNPPWDAIQFKSKEFFANYNFAVLNARTKRERKSIEQSVLANLETKALFDHYVESFEQQKRANDVLYSHQKVYIEGDLAGRQSDLFRVFMERNAQLLAGNGRAGVVVPSAFHANEGATGVRQLYFEKLKLVCCYSFENRRKLFDIHSSFKFALVVADHRGPTGSFPCAFYLHDDAWLFEQNRSGELLYDLDFVKRTGGEYFALCELRSVVEHRLLSKMFAAGQAFGDFCESAGVRFGRELDTTNDAWRFQPARNYVSAGVDPRDPEVSESLLKDSVFLLMEGKHFWHFDDRWEDPCAYVVPRGSIADRELLAENARWFRLGFRKIASSTNERTFVLVTLPPGRITTDSVYVEVQPRHRPTAIALALQGVGSTFCTDFLVRQIVSANVNLFMINRVGLPPVREVFGFLAHTALRLTANHRGYEPLWREQLGEAWREAGPAFQFPAIAREDSRWELRAALDALVAELYGLSRDEYATVLGRFSHSSRPDAPSLCLAHYDELAEQGREVFCGRHDPYRDLPLVEALAHPAISLQLGPLVAAEPQADMFGAASEIAGTQGGRGGRRRQRT